MALFKFGVVDDETYKSELFLKHSRGVIGMVDAAVDLLEKGDMDSLVAALRDLGAKHAAYDVKEEHYPIVGQALLDTLEKALGDGFTPEVKAAWVGVYDVITENMLAGAAQFFE
jgi:hemoglobin-like flavoprotein